MQSVDDSVLLRQYSENHSDEAFAALVTRHINLVYSVAVRSIHDPHLAEEVVQAVFTILAKKAKQLHHDKALSSWLFQTTRLTANNAVRSELRRHRREQEAHMQSVLNDSGSDIWSIIAPMLDDAVEGLNDKDRLAIVLRFYEGKNLHEVGTALGASRDAVEKRISRAVDKLREFFIKHGVTISGSGLAVLISSNAVQAAPPGLAVTISSGATVGTALAAAVATHSVMNLVRRLLLVAAIASCAMTPFVIEHYANKPAQHGGKPVQNPLTLENAASQRATLTSTSTLKPGSPEKGEMLNRMAQGKTRDAIVLSTALTQYVAKQRGPLPLSFDSIASFLLKLPPLTGTNDFEILRSGSFEEMRQMQSMPVAIIRERYVWLTQTGKRARVYGMLGGYAEIVVADDNFQAWEARHLLASPSTAD
jgi:RNA polymerase sigma factor (sigma-70 family)